VPPAHIFLAKASHMIIPKNGRYGLIRCLQQREKLITVSSGDDLTMAVTGAVTGVS
jgi:hypothetical protein